MNKNGVTNGVTNRDGAEFVERGLHELTAKETALVNGGVARPVLLARDNGGWHELFASVGTPY
jgi:hypothetical protein